MRWWFRRRRDRGHERRVFQLRQALIARENALLAFDRSAVVDVLGHTLDAVSALDSAIQLLAERVPELRDEAANLRPAIYVPETHVPEEWN